MTYDPRYKKVKMSGAKRLWIVLGAFYFVCIIAIVYIWLYYNKNILETENSLFETKNSTDDVIKETLEGFYFEFHKPQYKRKYIKSLMKECIQDGVKTQVQMYCQMVKKLHP